MNAAGPYLSALVAAALANGKGVDLPGPSFVLPLVDAGAGAVNTTPTTNLGSGTPNFIRATSAWTKLSSGLWAPVSTGVARSIYAGFDTTVGSYQGYLPEEARTNQCLQARDLSNASWTKTNATAAKDQVGIDGVANSASSLTATAGGGSCLQTIVQAATAAALSFFLKRITGSGTVVIQQGASTLDVTASLNSVTYTRVDLNASVLNPSIGIVLGTNGDKIAVDMGQFENTSATFADSTTPIPTTTIAVARNADQLLYPIAGNLSDALGTLYAEIIVPNIGDGGGAGIICFNGVTGANGFYHTANGAGGAKINIFDSTTAVGTAAFQPITDVFSKAAAKWNATSAQMSTFVNGGSKASGAYDGTFMAVNFGIGARQSFYANRPIRNIRGWTRELSDAEVAALL